MCFCRLYKTKMSLNSPKRERKRCSEACPGFFHQRQILFSGWGGQKYFHYGQNRAQMGADNFLPPPPVNKFCPLGKTEGGGGQKIFFITLPLCPPGELFFIRGRNIVFQISAGAWFDSLGAYAPMPHGSVNAY